ncbi:hypothetical protein [Paraburkholderia graminis]
MSLETDAEQRYRDAFTRLKDNVPRLLPRGTPVTQNNIAREAGSDASAFRRTRYPTLHCEVQAWIKANARVDEKLEKRKKLRRQRETLKQTVTRLKKERDSAQSELVSAHRSILDLLETNAMLRTKIDELRPPPTPLHD